ncbi:MazG nucleotide pyrophosphohydrolase domain-containing protein [Streptomyces sp. NPDC057702]|uniref:MazG nucleotide pyrophosphohydrolase domain-containing protein n=1 Tax=unclassified Streptomyces TaxID=2593676 RepID=UPI0036889FF5
MDIRTAQTLTWQNKIEKGFNTTDVPLEFGLLTAEVGEAFTAWRRSLPDFGEELADVFLYVAALAEMNGLDLGQEVARKIEKNRHRVYATDAQGVPVRVGDDQPADSPPPAADSPRPHRRAGP